jgi:hypothetical protein
MGQIWIATALLLAWPTISIAQVSDSAESVEPMPPYGDAAKYRPPPGYGQSGTGEMEGIPTKERQALIDQCQAIIKDRLRAPSLAIFTTREPVVTAEDGVITVMGELEGMNGFGGYKRARYLCKKNREEVRFDPQAAFLFEN